MSKTFLQRNLNRIEKFNCETNPSSWKFARSRIQKVVLSFKI